MLFDTGSTLTFNFNIYKKIYLLKCSINSFVKRFDSNLKKLESALPENASTEVSFFMVYGFHPPLPISMNHDFNKIEFSLPKYVSTQLPTYQTKLFLKRKDL